MTVVNNISLNDVLLSFGITIECLLLIDIINFFIKKTNSKKRLLLLGTVSFVSSIVLNYIHSSLPLVIFLFLFIILVIVLFSWLLLYMMTKEDLSKKQNEKGKNIWQNRKVMVIVPHEDDELNLCGGILDEYIEYGSDVYIVFVTNGDYKKQSYKRINESIKCWTTKGINESQLIFLGYGDGWNENYPHIYNAEKDDIVESLAGRTQTYGIDSHPAYNDGNKYTYRHLFDDLLDVIVSIRPDTLFVSDYDNHPDHRAVSLLFEKVMGSILKSNLNYKPYVFKGYAYKTAWEAIDDYHSINIKSTKDKFDEYCFNIYDWKQRFRFPISEKCISKSIFKSSLYGDLCFYESQFAESMAGRIINGDKVFWQRRTDSLLYKADIYVSSGNKDCLTSFNILDTTDVRDKTVIPSASSWQPFEDDKSKSVTIRFNEEKDVYCLSLYESISPVDKIKNILIRFDDGTSLNTGELNHDGSSTVIIIDKKGVLFFTLSITDFEGEKVGLTQIEAFETDAQQYPGFIKIIDSNDDFVYDYIVVSETTRFLLYSNAKIPNLDIKAYSVYIDNPKCRCCIKDNFIEVHCPKGQHCCLTVSNDRMGLTDTVHLYHIGLIKKKSIELFQIIDKNRFLGYKLQLCSELIRIAKRVYKGLKKRIWSKHE